MIITITLASDKSDFRLPCCTQSLRVGHAVIYKLVLLVQSAPIGQNIPGEQLISANVLRDNGGSETTQLLMPLLELCMEMLDLLTQCT